MAKKSKNKASKRWISKVINHIQSKLRGDREFWAPVNIALGLTSLLNFPYVSLTSINGCISLIVSICAGLILIVPFGILIALRKDRKLWSRILIPSSFSLFFFGTRIEASNPIMGLSIMIVSALIVFVGFRLAPRYRRVDSIDKERKQG